MSRIVARLMSTTTSGDPDRIGFGCILSESGQKAWVVVGRFSTRVNASGMQFSLRTTQG
jgi:hypothetical protein